MISHLKSLILDILFPIECLSCGAPNTYVCEDCFDSIPLLERDFCMVCNRSSYLGRTHKSCAKYCYIDGVVTATHWRHPLVKNMIHTCKYSDIPDLMIPLSRILRKRISAHPYLGYAAHDNGWTAIPVPLHKKRERRRGFNQAHLLSKLVFSDIDTKRVLMRIYPTPPQAKKKKRAKRLSNIAGSISFEQINCETTLSKKIILVDDVFTTGATLNECAKVLKTAGVKEVWGAAVAHG